LGEHTDQIFYGEPWNLERMDRQAGKNGGLISRKEPTLAEGPLSGVRVLDFTWVWAGPYCTLQLAHLIRVETSKRPCPNRLVGPFPDKQPGLNRAGCFNQYNQGKRSIFPSQKRSILFANWSSRQMS
jgi:hypothetical protein